MTKAIATRYRWAGLVEKTVIVDELCALAGWHCNTARKALGQALRPRVVRPCRPRAPVYDPGAALRFRWAVLGAPTGKSDRQLIVSGGDGWWDWSASGIACGSVDQTADDGQRGGEEEVEPDDDLGACQ